MNSARKEDGREARKTISRQKLIQTAFVMIKSGGPDAITMRRLAEEAEMAPATAYNVLGSKSALFEAMFEELNERGPELCLDELPGDELQKVLAVVDRITNDWINPDGLHRTLLQATKATNSLAPILFPKVQPRLMMLVERLVAKGWIHDTVPSADLANRIAFANAGLFDAWVDGWVSDAALGREHRLNILVALQAVATINVRGKIDAALARTLAMDGHGAASVC